MAIRTGGQLSSAERRALIGPIVGDFVGYGRSIRTIFGALPENDRPSERSEAPVLVHHVA